ncbi:pantoate--beta-alanine ligase [Pedobacter alpinus]|uniref:Pantothenate synthetase n=1 Tax=Pedobacter alpinus TaxID=1590643 RepID=A0ABW5TMH0_9SPHI
MKSFKTKDSLKNYLQSLKKGNVKIGLVPTMGALHQGHVSLIEVSKKHCDITIATIFVNPTQFNNVDDLLKYPKPINQDQKILEAAGCDILFNPETREMYDDPEVWDYEVGELNTVLEGYFRPGHYKGVTQIVYKLFNLVKPDLAFFGQKDYQQFLVIKKMTEDFNLGIKLYACPIIRETDGLAMSSRNIRLSPTERIAALQISKSLYFTKKNYTVMPIADLKEKALKFYTNNSLLNLEYFEIVSNDGLKPLSNKKNAIALVACTVGNTRLIDNMMLD